jgi:hypothetical protein
MAARRDCEHNNDMTDNLYMNPSVISTYLEQVGATHLHYICNKYHAHVPRSCATPSR